MSEEYQEYDPSDTGDEECFELYAKKLKEMLNEKKEYEYPLNKKNIYVGDVGRTKPDKIDPCKFVDLAIPKAHIRKCSLPYIMDAYKYGTPELDPVWFLVNSDCDIVGHQGRHRAQVACDLGIKEIPILLKYHSYVYPDDEYGYADYNKMREVSKLVTEKDNDWENLNKYNDELIYPNECSIDKLKRQELGAFRIGSGTIEDAIKRKKELRDKYGITKLVKKHK